MRIANYLLVVLAVLLVIGEIMRGWFGLNGYGLLALSLLAPILTLVAVSGRFHKNTNILAIVANMALIGCLSWLMSRLFEGGNIYAIAIAIMITAIPALNFTLLLKQLFDSSSKHDGKQKVGAEIK